MNKLDKRSWTETKLRKVDRQDCKKQKNKTQNTTQKTRQENGTWHDTREECEVLKKCWKCLNSVSGRCGLHVNTSSPFQSLQCKNQYWLARQQRVHHQVKRRSLLCEFVCSSLLQQQHLEVSVHPLHNTWNAVGWNAQIRFFSTLHSSVTHDL